jgi:hypothetical protein
MEVVTIHTLAEHGVISAVQWLKLGIETLGACIIAIGVLASAWLFLKALLVRQTADFTAIRLTLARYLAGRPSTSS